MRRGLTFAALALLLASCAGAQGPSQAVPLGSVSPAIGLDDAAARQAVRDFVQAYANAPQDGGKSLFPLASGSLMFRWIHWTGVENQTFPGMITAEATITSIGPVVPLVETMNDGSTLTAPGVELQASVTYHYQGSDGSARAKTFSLDGLVELLSSAPGLWQIQQFTQDGKQLHQFVAPVDVSSTVGDVRVTFDTLLITPDHWTVGIHVSNQSTATVRPKEAVLTQPTGSPIQRLPLIASASVAASQGSDILIEMLPQPPTGNLAVTLLVGTATGDHPFTVALSQLLAHVPLSTPPSPTPSATATPVPSPS